MARAGIEPDLWLLDLAPTRPRGKDAGSDACDSRRATEDAATRCAAGANGEGRNRTGDTTIFSRVLYQLSYLAAAAGW